VHRFYIALTLSLLQENENLPSVELGQDNQFDEAPLDTLHFAPGQHDLLANGARAEGPQEPSLFNLDDNDDSANPPPLATLNDLASMQKMIEQIRNASFNDEEDQWSSADFDSFIHPPHEQFRLDDPQLRLSMSTYLSLSAHSSEATYEAVRKSIKECYPDSTMLSFDQVRNRLKSISKVLTLHFDMCVNSCIAFTSTFSELETCPFCGEDRFQQSQGLTKSIPRRQFATLPIGPQLQALWRHPVTVAKLRYRLKRTAQVLAERGGLGGLQDYDDICCGSEYLDLVQSGKISDNDMLLNISMDGAQLYRDKESDTWFGIASLIDFPPEVRHSREMVLPLFVIGGPNPPKHYDSFLFPTFSHLSACQRRGLRVWDASTDTEFISYPWLAFGTADTVGMAALNGWVGHHGRNGCRLLCSMPGRHKPGVGVYYPVMLRPEGSGIPPASSHPDIDINTIATPTSISYSENLQHVLTSRSTTQYEKRRRETGICKPSIISSLLKAFPLPGCFPADTMHLGLNLGQLLVTLWRGTLEHSKDDDPSTWPFAILRENQSWKTHGAAVAAANRYIPTCVETRTPRNPAEKISSGYKAIEYLVYIFGLCPALLYGALPSEFYYHFCKLVFGIRIIHQRHKSQGHLVAAHKALLEYVYQFELLYYQRKMIRLHFIRPCIHALVHLVPEHFRIGSLTEASQWTMERTIGNLGEEIRLHSDPYANLTQRIIERSRINAIKNMAPDLATSKKELPAGALDIGSNFVLLGPRQLCQMDEQVSKAMKAFALSQDWHIQDRHTNLHRFARLLLPNGQIARSLWHEKKRPVEKVRIARNVKVRGCMLSEGLAKCSVDSFQ
jgi:hypothetical protein